MTDISLNFFYDMRIERDGDVIWEGGKTNTVTLEGQEYALDRMFGNVDQEEWYIGLIGEGVVLETDTMTSHNWREIYHTSPINRVKLTLTKEEVAGRQRYASQEIQFIVTDIQYQDGSPVATHLRGAFITTQPNKDINIGILYGGADFANSQQLEYGDAVTVKVYLGATA